METSKNIAAIVGPVFVALGISILANPNLGTDIVEQMRGNVLIVLIAGILTLSAGLAILRFHRETAGWPLIVTVLGWLLVAGGLVRIVAPQAVMSVGESMATTPGVMTAAACLLLALGAFLSWQAYLGKSAT